jgi:hypothetical protein
LELGKQGGVRVGVNVVDRHKGGVELRRRPDGRTDLSHGKHKGSGRGVSNEELEIADPVRHLVVVNGAQA